MRILFFDTKTSPFFLALDIPSSRQLSRLQSLAVSFCDLLFGWDDGEGRLECIEVDSILKESIPFLDQNALEANERAPKSVEHRDVRANRTFGPAKGLSGFAVNGQRGSAFIEGNGVEVTLGTHVEMVFSDVYPVDDGELIIRYSGGSPIYSFVSRIHKAVSPKKHKQVWVQIEH